MNWRFLICNEDVRACLDFIIFLPSDVLDFHENKGEFRTLLVRFQNDHPNFVRTLDTTGQTTKLVKYLATKFISE
jgi:hypothetical protein